MRRNFTARRATLSDFVLVSRWAGPIRAICSCVYLWSVRFVGELLGRLTLGGTRLLVFSPCVDYLV